MFSKNMHTEIFTEKQIELLPVIRNFQRSFFLVGGTAIALHIGHRHSIDFDLFSYSKLNKSRIKSKLLQVHFNQVPLFEDFDQLYLIINDVKVTFFSFPYPVTHPVKFNSVITLPSLLSLAAMKAFALGRRSKWKDYVDLYFILRDYYNVDEISGEAKTIFSEQFSEKLFREQLAFHKDIDFSEPVEFIGPSIVESEIKEFLIDKAIDLF
jgi:hypothetical protein